QPVERAPALVPSVICPTFTQVGQITEGTNAGALSTGWCATDHTPGGGTGFLMVNGLTSANGNNRAWYETVPVTPGKPYRFKVSAINLCFDKIANPEIPAVELV